MAAKRGSICDAITSNCLPIAPLSPKRSLMFLFEQQESHVAIAAGFIALQLRHDWGAIRSNVIANASRVLQPFEIAGRNCDDSAHNRVWSQELLSDGLIYSNCSTDMLNGIWCFRNCQVLSSAPFPSHLALSVKPPAEAECELQIESFIQPQLEGTN